MLDRQSRFARGEWHEAARVLHRANPDWSNARIARSLGVTQSAVWKVLNPEKTREMVKRDNADPERHARKLAWQRAKDASEAGRARCEGCGEPAGYGSARRATQHCQGCTDATADVRRTLAEGMWADGWTVREMAEAYGISKDLMGVNIATWRARGHAAAFPHRRTPEQVQRIRDGWARVRFPEAA